MATIDVLRKFKQIGEATAAEVGTTRVGLVDLEEDGLITKVGVRKTGKRGRPAVEYKLTTKGSDKLRRTVDHR